MSVTSPAFSWGCGGGSGDRAATHFPSSPTDVRERRAGRGEKAPPRPARSTPAPPRPGLQRTPLTRRAPGPHLHVSRGKPRGLHAARATYVQQARSRAS
ncbi:serine/threonine-protein kinase BRSK1-like [Mesocricetus auratus]|uniref:Serine/threonine-protein kinase BRSK1-like n=1 Tax=Mesocricetus auratus TaxID=10036 RepID=A0ABM2X881_MESAU|nr:serine/threonine-protein kinase BRSK1-like [Mesocricetus auratus]